MCVCGDVGCDGHRIGGGGRIVRVRVWALADEETDTGQSIRSAGQVKFQSERTTEGRGSDIPEGEVVGSGARLAGRRFLLGRQKN